MAPNLGSLNNHSPTPTGPHIHQRFGLSEAGCSFSQVVLSTNIAESSVTIPDVVIVIDAGLQRGIFCDAKRKMRCLMLNWCAQASVKQRTGRTGRVAAGTIIHLFPRKFHDEKMLPFDDAEV